jgi:hypothetical protein
MAYPESTVGINLGNGVAEFSLEDEQQRRIGFGFFGKLLPPV